jgi:hypothetical protein
MIGTSGTSGFSPFIFVIFDGVVIFALSSRFKILFRCGYLSPEIERYPRLSGLSTAHANRSRLPPVKGIGWPYRFAEALAKDAKIRYSVKKHRNIADLRQLKREFP